MCAHVCPYSCVCRCTYVQLCVQGRACVRPSLLSHLEAPPPCTLRQSSTGREPSQASLAGLRVSDICESQPSQHWDHKHVLACLAFYVGSGVEPGPQTCKASTLPVEPSPGPEERYLSVVRNQGLSGFAEFFGKTHFTFYMVSDLKKHSEISV